MSTRFEVQHPRCAYCGAWGKRRGDKVHCNSPRCARVGTYTGPPETLIPPTGYRLPKPKRRPKPVKNYPPMQDELDLEGDQDGRL